MEKKNEPITFQKNYSNIQKLYTIDGKCITEICKASQEAKKSSIFSGPEDFRVYNGNKVIFDVPFMDNNGLKTVIFKGEINN